MKIKSLTLLLLAAALLEIPATLGQQRDPAQRRQQLLQRQAKQQQEQGNRRKLVSRTRVNSQRKQTVAPEEVSPALSTLAANEEVLTTRAFTTQGLTTPALTTVTEEPIIEVEIPQPVQEPSIDAFANQVPVRTKTRTQSRPAVPVAQQPTANKKTVATKTSEEIQEKKPNVETIRRYSFENSDGSFTFGYENADGSFKEETRGADCVVRGKYGYVDPDGVRREFSYVSGNPCDKTKKEDDDDEPIEEEAAPVIQPQAALRPNVQRRPNIPNIPESLRPVQRPVQQVQPQPELTIQEGEEELLEVLRNPQSRPRPKATETNTNTRIQRPRPNQRPVQAIENQEFAAAPVTLPPRPTTQVRAAVVPVTPPTLNNFDFEQEVQRFSGERQVSPLAVQRPVPQQQRQEQDLPRPNVRPTGIRSFTSELVFDPTTNQFRTAVVQRIPEAQTEISIMEQLVGFVSTTTPRPEPTTTVPTTQPPRIVEQPKAPLDSETNIDFDSFGPPRQQVERQQQRPSFPFTQPSFNSQPAGFRQQPQFVFDQPQRQPQFPSQNPFAPSQQQFRNQPFNPPQLQRFQPVQTQPQSAQIRTQPRPPVQGSNIAAGQIDSFLSTLG